MLVLICINSWLRALLFWTRFYLLVRFSLRCRQCACLCCCCVGFEASLELHGFASTFCSNFRISRLASTLIKVLMFSREDCKLVLFYMMEADVPTTETVPPLCYRKYVTFKNMTSIDNKCLSESFNKIKIKSYFPTLCWCSWFLWRHWPQQVKGQLQIGYNWKTVVQTIVQRFSIRLV